MPKIGMEPKRRAALVEATIGEIGSVGSLDVTVGQIARRAGMSPALAHHYFGGKAQIFLAAMRHILSQYSAEVRSSLRDAAPEQRLRAIIDANFAQSCFEPDTISAWLNFYVLAQRDDEAARLLRIYQRRLRSNLLHALRNHVSDPAPVAEVLGALIDGMYLRAALDGNGLSRDAGSRVWDAARAMITKGQI
ncbi:transcriptional regulator BetI [Puniceibacterium sp. IMCC21224]|uniref:choline-binding transcriptional repressor BetI n=1 Tax=Puniceibacterium sp. IMCC21224 TaxID=1618204 RepID=UPI00064DA195|nr:transcriptional regulator BetI [Puniceibacterium sp. IMCC21224]KMK67799.1 transcriptional regulator, TetR family [Puniceibacterium sp. IMCC21224]